MMTCGACGQATYCSKACQINAWPGHKGLCKAVVKSSMSSSIGHEPLKKWLKLNNGLVCQAASQELWKNGLVNTHGLVMQLDVVVGDDNINIHKIRVSEIYTMELYEVDKLLSRDSTTIKPAGHMLVAFFAKFVKDNQTQIIRKTMAFSGGSGEGCDIAMSELIARMNL